MALICLHFEKTVKGYQYGYQMNALDLGVKNMLFVDRLVTTNPYTGFKKKVTSRTDGFNSKRPISPSAAAGEIFALENHLFVFPSVKNTTPSLKKRREVSEKSALQIFFE